MANPVRALGNVIRALAFAGDAAALLIPQDTKRLRMASVQRPLPRRNAFPRVQAGATGTDEHVDQPVPDSKGQGISVWSYDGQTGPEYWTDLKPGYAPAVAGSTSRRSIPSRQGRPPTMRPPSPVSQSAPCVS